MSHITGDSMDPHIDLKQINSKVQLMKKTAKDRTSIASLVFTPTPFSCFDPDHMMKRANQRQHNGFTVKIQEHSVKVDHPLYGIKK